MNTSLSTPPLTTTRQALAWSCIPPHSVRCSPPHAWVTRCRHSVLGASSRAAVCAAASNSGSSSSSSTAISSSSSTTTTGSGSGDGAASSSGTSSAALRTCRRCKSKFDPAENHDTACRYHVPGALYSGGEISKALGFVRQSGAPQHQLKAVVGRTGLLRFWDCCGAPDHDSLGCCVGRHVTYDDADD